MRHFRSLGLFAVLMCMALLALSARADQGYPHAGVQVVDARKSFKDLFNYLDMAIRKHRMGVVGRASASMGVARLGVEIPGNGVYGVSAMILPSECCGPACRRGSRRHCGSMSRKMQTARRG